MWTLILILVTLSMWGMDGIPLSDRERRGTEPYRCGEYHCDCFPEILTIQCTNVGSFVSTLTELDTYWVQRIVFLGSVDLTYISENRDKFPKLTLVDIRLSGMCWNDVLDGVVLVEDSMCHQTQPEFGETTTRAPGDNTTKSIPITRTTYRIPAPDATRKRPVGPPIGPYLPTMNFNVSTAGQTDGTTTNFEQSSTVTGSDFTIGMDTEYMDLGPNAIQMPPASDFRQPLMIGTVSFSIPMFGGALLLTLRWAFRRRARNRPYQHGADLLDVSYPMRSLSPGSPSVSGSQELSNSSQKNNNGSLKDISLTSGSSEEVLSVENLGVLFSVRRRSKSQ